MRRFPVVLGDGSSLLRQSRPREYGERERGRRVTESDKLLWKVLWRYAERLENAGSNGCVRNSSSEKVAQPQANSNAMLARQ